MISRNFYFQVIFRVLLVAAATSLTGWTLAMGDRGFIVFALITAAILLTINLISYLNSTNRKLSYFLEAIRNNDSALKFPEKISGRPIRELYHGLNKVNEQIQQLKIGNQQREQYFQTLLEHLATGILTFNSKGFVLHANSSAKNILGMDVLTHINQIERVNRNLFQAVQNIRPFDQRLVTVATKRSNVELSLKATSIKTTDDELILLSLQDIRNEMDEKELDSWMKLIRVLMHEIMNSIAPITSLAESLSKFFMNGEREVLPSEIDSKMIGMTIRGLNVINEQGNGLMRFVESYRKLTRLPKLEMKVFRVQELADRVKVLYPSLENSHRVKFQVRVNPPEMELLADENLISQVLINLLKNALEALAGNPEGSIQFRAGYSTKGTVELSVADNGPGIPEEIIEQIFVPFFTTREKGSGIGLSLSRQIMRLHNGTLRVHSVPDKETVFTLSFQ